MRLSGSLGSSSGHSFPSAYFPASSFLHPGSIQSGKRVFEAGQREKTADECCHAEGAGGLSLSRSSSSASLTGFVHSVRVDSGGRGDAPVSSPVYHTSMGARRRGVESGTQKDIGLVPLKGGDKTDRNETEMTEEEAVFSSARSPGMLRRRPLGPVRRSEEMVHPQSSR